MSHSISNCVCHTNFTYFIDINYDIWFIGKDLHGESGCKVSKKKENTSSSPLQINSLKNIKTLACGEAHVICSNFDGEVFSFGFNEHGQLGINKTYDEVQETHIPQLLNLPFINNVYCGDEYSICLSYDGYMYGFGCNEDFQLGFSSANDIQIQPKKVPNLQDIEIISCGAYFTICKTQGEYFAFGYNSDGQLGVGNNIDKKKQWKCDNWPCDIIDIKSGADHTLLLTYSGQVYIFGDLGGNTKHSTPTLLSTLPEIQKIECGYQHSLCIDINNNLWVFGSNNNGQLGLGTENNWEPIINNKVHNIIDISHGGLHSFIKNINNEIYAFGDNSKSQFGVTIYHKNELNPIRVFNNKEDIWNSNRNSRQKSARK